MLLIDYLRWWYGRGWKELFLGFLHRVRGTARDFSVIILLNTLLKPWRQTIETGQRNLGDRLRAALGNLISRGVGASVRVSALFAACLLILGETSIAIVLVIAWPFIPIAGIGLIVWGVV